MYPLRCGGCTRSRTRASVPQMADPETERLALLRREIRESPGWPIRAEFAAVARSYRLFIGNDDELQGYLAMNAEPEKALELWRVDNPDACAANRLYGLLGLRGRKEATVPSTTSEEPARLEAAAEALTRLLAQSQALRKDAENALELLSGAYGWPARRIAARSASASPERAGGGF